MRRNASAALGAAATRAGSARGTSSAHIRPAPSSRSLPMRRSVLVLALLSIPSIPSGAIAQGFRLTVESIMRGPDLVGTAPSNVRFSADGRYVYFSWRAPGVDTLDRDYRVAVADRKSTRLNSSHGYISYAVFCL